MTVAQLLDNLTSREITEWGLYFRIKAAEEKLRSGNTDSSWERPEMMGGHA